MGDADYLHAFQRIVMPIGIEFSPDLVISSFVFLLFRDCLLISPKSLPGLMLPKETNWVNALFHLQAMRI